MNTHLSRTRRGAQEVVGGVLRASCLRKRALVAVALAGFALTAGASRLEAQYGVARRTTVVAGPNGVARRTTVAGPNGVASRTTVAGPGGVASRTTVAGLPSGYYGALPSGYRVMGGGIYMAGGVRYRARFYQGRTVYVRI
jgi:hypothetical protein